MNPSYNLLRARWQIGAIRDECLVLMSLDDAEARQRPRELPMLVRFDDDESVRTVCGKGGCDYPGGMIPGKRSADDYNVDRLAVFRGGTGGEFLGGVRSREKVGIKP